MISTGMTMEEFRRLTKFADGILHGYSIKDGLDGLLFIEASGELADGSKPRAVEVFVSDSYRLGWTTINEVSGTYDDKWVLGRFTGPKVAVPWSAWAVLALHFKPVAKFARLGFNIRETSIEAWCPDSDRGKIALAFDHMGTLEAVSYRQVAPSFPPTTSKRSEGFDLDYQLLAKTLSAGIARLGNPKKPPIRVFDNENKPCEIMVAGDRVMRLVQMPVRMT